ncbi:MAG: hypothetical protein JW729_01725 [Bacteroidales bacterium]|nr:hypothetical protein [Bacteroidales bacterium]
MSSLILFANLAKAQYYAGGQSPGSLKWKQINSSYFQIIFPEGFEEKANYVANVLEYARVLDGKTLNNYPPKISILLHNQTVESNAEVGWAPRRIEMFTQPPQDTYAQDWLQQLALHEYRHVVQIDKMNQGITRVLYALFGQQITAGVYGLFVPWWFIEGDAVVMETALSQSGRGRQPFFEMELRAQLLQKGAYSYDKAAHGSYKDFTPSHYHLGYYLVGSGRINYGDELWNNALNQVAKKPFTITPFSNSIKKQTGYSKVGFYEEMLSNLDSIWTKETQALQTTNLDTLTNPQSYISYLNPQAFSEEYLVCVKKDYRDVTKLILMDQNGKETVLKKLGWYMPETLSVNNELILWAEQEFDPRWTYRTYTKIYSYSLAMKKVSLVSSKKRYFSPQLNREASKMVVVESSANYEHSLAVIELAGGKKERNYSTASNDFLSYPSWSEDSKKIVAVALGNKGKTLIEFDVLSGDYNYLLPFSYEDITKPIYWKNDLLFQGSYSGISNIYALDKASKQVFQVTSSAFGAHSPAVWNGKLLFSEYRANGNQIALTNLNQNEWIPLNEISDTHYSFANELHQQEDTLLVSDSIPKLKYQVKNYSKLAHLINPHSWGPFSFSADNYGFKPGITLNSQNKLSTFILSLGYEYDLNYQEGTYFADANYLGWYPALNLRAEYGYRERLAHDSEQDSTFLLRFNETNLRTGMSIPLFFSSGNWYQRFTPRITYEYRQLDVLNSGVQLRQSNFKILDYSFTFSNYQVSAKQAIYPKWGQQLSFLYQHTPFDDSGDLVALSSMLYFPGLIKHQGVRMYFAFQQKFGQADYYNEQIAMARGYFGLSFTKSFSYKLDYALPLAYPDWSLGSVVFIKRITTIAFFDETRSLDVNRVSYQSVGNDLLFDVHFLRSFIPFQVGLRSVYLFDTKSTYFGFLGAINL